VTAVAPSPPSSSIAVASWANASMAPEPSMHDPHIAVEFEDVIDKVNKER